VELSTSSSTAMATQSVIAGSDVVLSGTQGSIRPPVSLPELRKIVEVRGEAGSVMSVTASAKTAAEAERIANAVARSYVAYVQANDSPKKLTATVFQPASYATGRSLAEAAILTAVVGGLVGLLIGIIAALVLGRGSRRLRFRDELADAIGVPVLASIPVSRPGNVRAWSKLLESYEPSAEHAWRLRSALRYLGLPDVMTSRPAPAVGRSINVLSLASDRKALSIGPQLAVFAASRDLDTVLIIGPQQDAKPTEALRAACAAPPGSTRRASNLRVFAANKAPKRLPDAGLVVIVTVVDGSQPQLETTMSTTATVLGVSAGACSADELARVAASAASAGRQIDGILLADPDTGDPTTGRMPQVARPDQRMGPTRVTGLPMEARRRTGDFGS
jgi:capsular polysaccharide biosynthesis protein